MTFPDNDPVQWLLNVREHGIETANEMSDRADRQECGVCGERLGDAPRAEVVRYRTDGLPAMEVRAMVVHADTCFDEKSMRLA